MRVEILVVADVDWVDDLEELAREGIGVSDNDIEESIAEAIFDACKAQEGDGYHHHLDDFLSILTDYATAKIVEK